MGISGQSRRGSPPTGRVTKVSVKRVWKAGPYWLSTSYEARDPAGGARRRGGHAARHEEAHLLRAVEALGAGSEPSQSGCRDTNRLFEAGTQVFLAQGLGSAAQEPP